MAGHAPPHGPARVLVIAAEPLSGIVRLAMDHGAYETRVVGDARTARAAIAEWRPHLLIADVDLGGRQEEIELFEPEPGGTRTPAIALTRRGDLRSKLAAFDAGADDIIQIPLSPEELVARVLALMRRTYGETIPFIPVITIAGLRIDLSNRSVHTGGTVLHLTAIEQTLLYLLASNPGRVLSRETILDAIWGIDFIAESNLVDRHVRNLRVKLKDTARRRRYIDTVPRQGYRFIAS